MRRLPCHVDIARRAKVLFALLLLLLLVSLRDAERSAQAQEEGFALHWAHQELAEAEARRLLRGYPDGSVRPDDGVSRAEFCTLVIRAAGRDKAAQSLVRVSPSFSDLGPNHWAKGYIEACGDMGVFLGDDTGTARPDSQVTRAEAAVMIDRWLRVQGVEHIPEVATLADWASVPDWAKDSVARLFRGAVVRGDEAGRFRGTANVTRAEAVALVLRSLECLGARWDLEGRVAGVDLEADCLVLDSQGDRIEIPLALDCLLFVEGKSSDWSSLPTGSLVRLVLAEGGSRGAVIAVLGSTGN